MKSLLLEVVKKSGKKAKRVEEKVICSFIYSLIPSTICSLTVFDIVIGPGKDR